MAYIGNVPADKYTTFDKQTITGDGGTGYTLDHAVANAQEIEVFVNNVRQEPGVAYTVSGTTLTMTGNVASTDDFYVVYQGKAVQTVVPADDTITTAMLQDDAVGTAQLADDAVGADQIDSTASPTLNNLTLSGGLYVGGTGSANYLDDYEEGTWTVSITSTGGGSATLGSQTSGHYVKIGNVVYVHANIDMTTNSLNSGGLEVRGLPFTPSGTDGYRNSTAFFSYTVNVVPQPFGGTFSDGQVYIQVWNQGNNSTYQATGWDNGGRAVVSGFYFTL